jgi:hypothetical protein
MQPNAALRAPAAGGRHAHPLRGEGSELLRYEGNFKIISVVNAARERLGLRSNNR